MKFDGLRLKNMLNLVHKFLGFIDGPSLKSNCPRIMRHIKFGSIDTRRYIV
jgi:hypothetical protein